VKKFGSPLFVYSEKTIAGTHRELLSAFSLRYPKVRHAWSYKTNYLSAVCRVFHRLGSWAEVVSAMEYEMARRNHVDPAKIIFNGPFKPYDGLKRALLDGAMVNIDSMDELYDVERIAGETGGKPSIGVRVNLSLGQQQSWDRFGFGLENGDAHRVVKRIAAGGKVKLSGVHAHIGTFMLEPGHYKTAAAKLASFCKSIKDEFGISVKYLDIGGGFASRNRLKGVYLSTADTAPSFSAYAEAVCSELLDAFKVDELPLLILESGRAMIDEAGSLVSSVAATKRLSNGHRGIVLDAGVNLLFTSFWYDHEVVPTVDRGGQPVDHVLYGPLCMQIDVVRESIKLPPLEKGDSVVIRPVGAYNNTQWLQFITLRPNVVMISEKGEVALIREAETVDTVQERERAPAWMKKKH
jgi:diaminopimelate decarboxylase